MIDKTRKNQDEFFCSPAASSACSWGTSFFRRCGAAVARFRSLCSRKQPARRSRVHVPEYSRQQGAQHA